jgi:NitT/TauT family transport system substrate-binding protein
MKKILLLNIMLIIIVLTGCAKNEKENKVRVAYFPNITHAQALVMKADGMLEETLGDNYEVTWTSFNAGPAEVEAFFADEIDIGYMGAVPAINAYIKSGGDLSIIAGATSQGGVLVTRKDLVLNNLSELDGLTIAIPQLGNTQHLLLLRLIDEASLEITANGGTVNVVAVANSDIKTLMDQGQIDAALVPEPWGSILQSDIKANIFLDYDSIWPDVEYPATVIVVSKKFIAEHEDIVKTFITINSNITDKINSNLKASISIINNEIENVTSKKLEDQILNKAFQRVILEDEISMNAIEAFAEISMKEGFIDEIPDSGLIYIMK